MRVLLCLSLFILSTAAVVFKATLDRRKLPFGGSVKRLTQRRFHTLRRINKASGQEPIGNEYQEYITVGIGTPPQKVRLAPDLFSANLVVLSSECDAWACQWQNTFDPSESSTFKTVSNPESFDFNYSVYHFTGYYGVDKVTFAGLNIDEQEIAVTKTVTPEHEVLPSDGVLGLGLPATAIADSGLTPLQQITEQLDLPIFSLWFRPNSDWKFEPETSPGGYITFGGYDGENCGDILGWTPLSSGVYWQFVLSGFSISSLTVSNKMQAAPDMTYDYISMPSAYLQQIANALGVWDISHGGLSAPCADLQYAPNLVMVISGNQYSIPASEYVVGAQGGTCWLQFAGSDGDSFGPSWILGKVFLRSVCLTFDFHTKQIGFAPHKS